MTLARRAPVPTHERAAQRLREQLETDHLETIETDRLRPIDPDEPRKGSKPLLVLAAEDGRRFVLKLAEPALMMAEQVVYELRRLGGAPAVPARIVTLDIEGRGPTQGLLKPFVEFDSSRELSTDTQQWTELQRNVMLADHAWEWFLDNLDTNTGQFALLGPEEYPLNIDWDRSFATDGTSEFSRFAKYRATLPNARTFLYADYVEGRIHLEFDLLMRETKRIRALPAYEVQRLLQAYAQVRFETADERRVFVKRMLSRHRSIERQARSFVLALKRERHEFAGHMETNALSRLHTASKLLWNHWQVVLNAAFRGPIGRTACSILKRMRTRPAQQPLELPSTTPLDSSSARRAAPLSLDNRYTPHGV